MMLNQFIWGLQPELARFVRLRYTKSIVQVVSLAETTELVVKASWRPKGKVNNETNQLRGPNQSNRGQGCWNNQTSRGRGRSSGSRGTCWNRERNGGGRGCSFSGYDPLARYKCGVHGHLAHDCLSTSNVSMSGGNSGPTRGSSSRSGQSGPRRGRGRGRHVRFGGMNVLYDSEGYEYLVGDYGQICIQLEAWRAQSRRTGFCSLPSVDHLLLRNRVYSAARLLSVGGPV